jgi:hypothetical protein
VVSSRSAAVAKPSIARRRNRARRLIEQAQYLPQEAVRGQIAWMDHPDQPSIGQSRGPNELLASRLDPRHDHRRPTKAQDLANGVTTTSAAAM